VAQGRATPAPAAVKKPDALVWPLWESRLLAGIPARPTALTPPPWQLLGAALIDGQWQLIILREGAAQPQYHKEGDTLPGGYKIRAITQEDVTFRAGGREVVLSYIGYR
jgi:hypothetical protein